MTPKAAPPPEAEAFAARPLPLPADFYRGRARLRRLACVVVAILIAVPLALGAVGVLNLSVLLGPHVARSEWAFTMMGARTLNGEGLTGKGITVCVVDSGVDTLHPDFARLHLAAWKDFVNGRTDPYDDSGHGTAMAGLIAANGSLMGVAPDVGLIAVKVIDATGVGSSAVVAAGIRYCADPFGDGRMGADIISISLGSKAPTFVSTEVSDAATWATSRGIFVVAAAGNAGGFAADVEIPADVNLSIAVGAVDMNGQRAPFSSMGATLNRTDPNLKPEVVAPGVQVISTAPGAHYVTSTGTSPATALAAGVLALILQAHPELRPRGSSSNILTLKMAIMAAADKEPGQIVPHDPWYGYGLIDGPKILTHL